MPDKPTYVMGRVVLPEPGKVAVEPIGTHRRCAVNMCRRNAVGLFEWDKDIRVTLCQPHADHFKLAQVDG